MDEREWLASSDPSAMLEYVTAEFSGRRHRTRIAGDRKLRLFACACWRQIWPFVPGHVPPRWGAAAEYAEALADGNPFAGTLPPASEGGGPSVYDLSAEITHSDIRFLIANFGLPSFFSVTNKHAAVQAALLREVVGNPFRGVVREGRLLAATVGVRGAARVMAERTGCSFDTLRDAISGKTWGGLTR